MSRNRVETTMPQGVACYRCVDSIFTDNLMITAPGANHMTRMNIIGGSNNIIRGNTQGARPNSTPDDLLAMTSRSTFDSAASLVAAASFDTMSAFELAEYEDFLAFEDGWDFTGDFADKSYDTADYVGLEQAKLGLALAAVPEPGVWAQLIAGFGLVGAATRRRRRLQTMAAA